MGFFEIIFNGFQQLKKCIFFTMATKYEDTIIALNLTTNLVCDIHE